MNRHVLTSCFVVLALVVGTVALAAGPDDEHYEMRGVSSHWTSDEWTYTVDYENIRVYAERPNAQVLKNLTVTWEKPVLDALGNRCTLRGQVHQPDNIPQGTKPINWFQGVTVYLAKAPDAQPDWSNGMDQEDTLSATDVADPSGKFEVHFDLRESKHDRTKMQSFQFGLALAKHEGDDKTKQKVVWNSRTPVIATTVQMLAIPAAKELSRELTLLNQASGWPFQNPNGVNLIRCVNALQPLGKERALKVLEEYLELTKEYDSERELVFWIIRILFEPVRVNDRIPSPMIAVHLDDRKLPHAMKWPLNPMALYADVPFMLGQQIGMGGMPEHPSSHVQWARLHGVIRSEPLNPTVNPVAAAETILQSTRFKALDEFSREAATKALRSQGLAMVQNLLRSPAEDDDLDDEQWQTCLKLAAARGIYWDAKTQGFAVRK